MTSFQASRPKNKKKIAELLRAALDEAETLSPQSEISAKRQTQKSAEAPAGIESPAKVEIKTYDEDSQEFLDALRKLNPELLSLIKDQLGARTIRMVTGIFAAEEARKQSENSAEKDTESFDFETEEID